MNAKSIAMGVVAMVVATVLVVTCAVPIISDSVKTEDTFTNEGLFKLTKYDADTELTILWDYENPDHIYVNDEDIDLSNVNVTYNTTIFFSENAGIRLYYNHSGCQFMWATGTAAADLNDNETLTVTCSSGSISAVVTANGTPGSTINGGTYDSVICISNDGEYVMKASDVPAYMNGDSEFFGMGVTNITGAGNKVLRVEGTIDDGATATIVTTSGTTATLTEPVISDSEVNGYIDLYQLDKIAFKGQVSGSADTNITYSYFVVPYEVTAERSVHVDGPTGDIITVIPVLMVLGIVIGAVALFLTTRRD